MNFNDFGMNPATAQTLRGINSGSTQPMFYSMNPQALYPTTPGALQNFPPGLENFEGLIQHQDDISHFFNCQPGQEESFDSYVVAPDPNYEIPGADNGFDPAAAPSMPGGTPAPAPMYPNANASRRANHSASSRPPKIYNVSSEDEAETHTTDEVKIEPSTDEDEAGEAEA